jgi:hypothetical protein
MPYTQVYKFKGPFYSQAHPDGKAARAVEYGRPTMLAAATAYREMMGQGEGDQEAWLVARAKVMAIKPELGADQAGEFTCYAVHYATIRWPTWFWRPQKIRLGWWPPSAWSYRAPIGQ